MPGFSKCLPFAFIRQSTDIQAAEAHKPMPAAHRNPQVELFDFLAAQQLYRLRPQPIAAVLSDSPLFTHCCLHRDDRPKFETASRKNTE